MTMLSVPVFDSQGKAAQAIEVDEGRLGGRVRLALLRQAVQMYENNSHVCTKGHLTRGEVSGSTRKLYRQKHTGMARAGTRTVPQRRGGGLAFPPNTRDISYRMPRKALHAAARSALLARLRDGVIAVVGEITMDVPKTRKIVELLAAIEASGRRLLVVDGAHEVVWKSARNIPNVIVRRAADVNAFDLLNADRLIFTQAAFNRVFEALGS